MKRESWPRGGPRARRGLAPSCATQPPSTGSTARPPGTSCSQPARRWPTRCCTDRPAVTPTHGVLLIVEIDDASISIEVCDCGSFDADLRPAARTTSAGAASRSSPRWRTTSSCSPSGPHAGALRQAAAGSGVSPGLASTPGVGCALSPARRLRGGELEPDARPVVALHAPAGREPLHQDQPQPPGSSSSRPRLVGAKPVPGSVTWARRPVWVVRSSTSITSSSLASPCRTLLLTSSQVSSTRLLSSSSGQPLGDRLEPGAHALGRVGPPAVRRRRTLRRRQSAGGGIRQLKGCERA